MRLYEQYEKFLKYNTKLKGGTIKKYVSSLKTVINYFNLDVKNGMTYDNLINLFSNNEHIQKLDRKYNRRLSSAINYYKIYEQNNREITLTSKNKELWTDVEMDLTLAFYLKYGRLNSNNKELRNFTDKLNQLTGNNKPYKSIELRLGNYAAVDPDYEGKGLTQNSTNLNNKKYYKCWERNVNNQENLLIRLETLFEYDFVDDIILDDEQFEKISKGQIRTYSVEEIKKIENQKYDFNKTVNKAKYKNSRNTDPRLKATCISNSNYICQINNNHKTFTSIDGKHQYMECHHIIPVCAQRDKEFRYIKLDRIFNLVCLCPICHAQMHYGSDSEKEKIFNEICKIKKFEFNNVGISLDLLRKVYLKYYKNKV